jgi:hypothetical protein
MQQMGLNDDPEKHGTPRTLLTDENGIIVKGFVVEDHRVIVCEIAEGTGVARSTVCEIISDVSIHKFSARLVCRNAHKRAQ